MYIEVLGKLDLNALYAATTYERMLKLVVLKYEKSFTDRLPACTAAAGHPVETTCTILDIQNVSLSTFYRVKDYMFAVSKIIDNHYPECMGKFYIINAPFVFSTMWSFVKPWLDATTAAKIDILGSTYKDKLLAQIDADNLPKEFGGNCECHGGCSLSYAGPWNVAESETHGKVSA